MRNTITRTITESTINAVMIAIDNGQPIVRTLDPITVNGKINADKALKAVRKVHGKTAPVSVVSIDEKEVLYEISVDDFMKYAKRVDD